MTTPGELPVGQTITFYLHLNNYTGYNLNGLANGFRIYSPDGAQWNTTIPDTLPQGWETFFDLAFSMYSYSITGSVTDSVSFMGASMPWSGLPSWFNDTAFTITIGPINKAYIGKTICLDSSYFPSSGTWKWSSSEGGDTLPPWDGPHCYTIAPNTITFTGNLYYQDPVPPDTNQVPMRDIRIEMWDEELVFHDSLDYDITDDAGYFELGPVDNDDGFLQGKRDIFFRIYAENEATYLTKNLNGDKHKIQTVVGDELPSGVYDTMIVAALDSSGPFFISDILLNGYRKWFEYRPNNNPNKVIIVSNPGYWTSYDTLTKRILIDAQDYPPSMYPDNFDETVILHEYGHYLEDYFDFFDIIDTSQRYWISDSTPIGVTINEAWALFWASVVAGDKHLYNRALDEQGQLSLYEYANCENGEYGEFFADSFCRGTANNKGKNCIGAVTGVLWDIYDDVNDDYSTFGQIMSTCGQNPDSIWDTLSDGIGNILSSLLDRNVNGHHPDHIDEFWTAWFQPTSFNHLQAMSDIWYEHGELKCCIGIRGNIDGIGVEGSEIDIADIVYFIDYSFSLPPGPVPPCLEEADVNADGSIDIADIVYMIDYMFSLPPGPAPVSCP